MASGYTVKVNGVDIDLDDWFDPYEQGTKPGLTGYTVGAQDLRDRYAPIAFGTAAPVTHYDVTGVGDLNTLFAAKGTAAYTLAFSGALYSNEANNNAYLAFTSNTTSSWAVTGNGSVTGGPVSGTLTIYGAVTEFYLSDVQYASSAATIDSAPQNSWQPITAGLQVIKYRTLGLTGNAVTASCRLRFRNASGKVLSDNTLVLKIHATSPQ